MVSSAELKEKIRESAVTDWERHEADWGLNDGEGVTQMAVYQPDVNLRIEEGRKAVEDFQEEWSEKYPDTEHNESYSYWVVYNQSPVDHVVLVAVDGYRAYVPVPTRPESAGDPWTISKYEYMIGAAITGDYRAYNDRLEMGNIEVE